MTFRKLLYRALPVGQESSGIIQLSARAESSSSCKWGVGAPLVGTYGTGYHPKAEASLFLALFLNACWLRCAIAIAFLLFRGRALCVLAYRVEAYALCSR